MLTCVDAPRLLLPPLRQCAVRVRPLELSPSTASELGVPLPEHIRRSVPKRQVDYIAGRHCAVTALRELLPDFAGPIDSDGRAPRWPAGIVGSITHTTDFAWAAVARSTEIRSVGIDTEPLPGARSIDAIHRMVLCEDDELPEGEGLGEAARAALVFSAKESLFKCLFPLARKMFSYEHASVSFSNGTGSNGTGRFVSTLAIDLDAELVCGTQVEGSWVVDGDRVHSAVVLRRAREWESRQE